MLTWKWKICYVWHFIFSLGHFLTSWRDFFSSALNIPKGFLLQNLKKISKKINAVFFFYGNNSYQKVNTITTISDCFVLLCYPSASAIVPKNLSQKIVVCQHIVYGQNVLFPPNRKVDAIQNLTTKFAIVISFFFFLVFIVVTTIKRKQITANSLPFILHLFSLFFVFTDLVFIAFWVFFRQSVYVCVCVGKQKIFVKTKAVFFFAFFLLLAIRLSPEKKYHWTDCSHGEWVQSKANFRIVRNQWIGAWKRSPPYVLGIQWRKKQLCSLDASAGD